MDDQRSPPRVAGNGRGVGASLQTGWNALVTDLLLDRKM